MFECAIAGKVEEQNGNMISKFSITSVAIVPRNKSTEEKIQKEVKETVSSFQEKIKFLKAGISDRENQIRGLKEDIKALEIIINKERARCIHSYAEKKAAGIPWHELGKCEYCGESDY